MHALIAAQIAFCFIVSLAAGLFATTSHRLVNQPTGFSANGVVVLDTTARRPQLPNVWDDTIDHLGTVPGVEKVALSRWPLLDGNGWNGFIWVNAAPTEVLAYFLQHLSRMDRCSEDSMDRRQRFSPRGHFPGCRNRQRGLRKAMFQRPESDWSMVREGDRQRGHAYAAPGGGSGWRCALPEYARAPDPDCVCAVSRRSVLLPAVPPILEDSSPRHETPSSSVRRVSIRSRWRPH